MFQLVLLLFCVPLQLGIMYFSSNAVETRIYEYLDVIKSAVNQINLGSVFVKWLKFSDTTNSETIIYETRDSSDSHQGETAKTHRPDQVFLRVGFVVLQIQLGYTGVIIGWRLSDDGEPIYEILTSHPQIQGFKTEATQSSLYPLQYTYILHPELKKYFEGHNGSTQYIPLPWLKNLYPLD